MSKQIADKVAKILKCTESSSDRTYSAACRLLDEVAKAGKRKTSRDEVVAALQQICEESWFALRRSAITSLVDLLIPADTDLVPFLKQGLKDEDISYGSACGLLNVIGSEAYPDIVKVILNGRRELGTRSSLLSALCDHSGQRFNEGLPLFCDLKPKDLPLADVRKWADAGFPGVLASVAHIPTNKLAKLNIALPIDYLNFLQQHRASQTYECGDNEWTLFASDELVKKTKVDGKSVPNVRQLQRFARSFHEVTGEDSTTDARGKAYALDRLSDGIVIGSGDGGEVLYLDPADQNGVWIFFPDGGDVERAAKTVRAWLRKAKKLT